MPDPTMRAECHRLLDLLSDADLVREGLVERLTEAVEFAQRPRVPREEPVSTPVIYAHLGRETRPVFHVEPAESDPNPLPEATVAENLAAIKANMGQIGAAVAKLKATWAGFMARLKGGAK